jgi:hypothetical protein
MIKINKAFVRHFYHQEFSNAKYHYVNKNGNDSNDGLTPETAKLTIQAGINSLNEGDWLIIGFGTYIESIDVNVNFAQIKGEWGVTIVGTVTLSAIGIVFDTFQSAPLSGNAYDVTGDFNSIINSTSGAGVIGFNLVSSTNLIVDCTAIGYSQTGFNIADFNNRLTKCTAGGAGGNTRGFYLSNSLADSCVFDDCLSNNNVTAGYEVVANCQFNIFKNCISGSGDGKKIDENSTNIWVNFQDELPQQHNEFLYPQISGEGVSRLPITVDNLTTNDAGGTRDDRWYYGDIFRIIPKNAITEEYKFYGINIDVGTANKEIMFQLLFTNGIEASQNGGNDWDLGETIITVDDASLFLVDDWIWVTGDDRPNGEIMKITNIASNVITLVRETTASAGTGLRYDYDITPGNNKIYLVHRPTNTVFHKIDDNFSAPSARDFIIYRLSEIRIISANGACLIRCVNANDDLTVTFDVRAKIET